MTLIDDVFDDELPERYIAALLIIADLDDISVSEAHLDVSEKLAQMETDVFDDDKEQTRH